MSTTTSPQPTTGARAETVTLTDISVLEGVSLRPLNPDIVQKYRDTDGLPPVDLFGPDNVLGDGFHRVAAAKLRGDTTIEAIKYDGGKDEAIAHACSANVTHGFPLTSSERREGAKRLLKLGYPVKQVASRMSMDRSTVANVEHGLQLKGQIVNIHKPGTGRPKKVIKPLPRDLAKALPDTQAYRVAAIDDARSREAIARAAVDGNWDEPATRAAVKSVKSGKTVTQALAKGSNMMAAKNPAPNGVNPEAMLRGIGNRAIALADELADLLDLMDQHPEVAKAIPQVRNMGGKPDYFRFCLATLSPALSDTIAKVGEYEDPEEDQQTVIEATATAVSS